MLKRLQILLLFILFTIIACIIFNSSNSNIHAEIANGTITYSNEQKYWITTGTAGEHQIFCPKEHYDTYMSGGDFGRTDTISIVIYEQNPFISSWNKVIQILKYKDPWNEDLHRNIIPDKTYYRLIEEDFINVDNRKSIIIRIYESYPSDFSQMQLTAETFVTPHFDNISSAKEWLIKNKDSLELKPLTIVSDSVLIKWEEEKYIPTVEYTELSPKGLTYDDLLR